MEPTSTANVLQPLPLRLQPGDDLRRALEAAVAAHGARAAFVAAGIGSLRPTQLRLAGAASATLLQGDVEVLTLSGTVAADKGGGQGGGGSHLHLSVADADGRVLGGHAAYGCTVRTTAEVLLLLLPAWQFSREPDAGTGYDELVVRPLAPVVNPPPAADAPPAPARRPSPRG